VPEVRGAVRNAIFSAIVGTTVEQCDCRLYATAVAMLVDEAHGERERLATEVGSAFHSAMF
jgi:hypothetical protein